MVLIKPLRMPDHIKRVGLVLLSLAVGGCSTTMQEVIPKDQPSMLTIYHTHNDGAQGGDSEQVRATVAARPLDNGFGDLDGYTRTAANEIDDLFPRLANPDLVMFVYPHVSGAGAPIPGYSTVFPMYDTVEYALPGEGNY